MDEVYVRSAIKLLNFLEQQWEKLMAEKEEAIQDLERNFKRKLIDAETKFRYFWRYSHS